MENRTEKEIQGQNNTNKEIDFLDIIIVLLKWKKIILGITLSVALFTVINSLRLPDKYIAETKILSSVSGGGGMLSRLQQLSGIDNSGGSLNFNFDTLVDIFATRSVADKVIDILGLENEDEYKEMPGKTLRGLISGSAMLEKKNPASSIITVSVANLDPEKAAAVANAFVEAVQQRLQELAVTEASQKRLFFEEELKRVHNNLIEAEEEMKTFQEKTGMVEVKGQFNISVDKHTPSLILKYNRLSRNLVFQEKLYNITLEQYESAKIAESRDPAVLQVIEKAIPSKKKFDYKTKRTIIVSSLFAFLFSVFLALLIEFFGKLVHREENLEKFRAMKEGLKLGWGKKRS